MDDDDCTGIVSSDAGRRAIQDDVIMREVDLVVACARDREWGFAYISSICQKDETSLVRSWTRSSINLIQATYMTMFVLCRPLTDFGGCVLNGEAAVVVVGNA